MRSKDPQTTFDLYGPDVSQGLVRVLVIALIARDVKFVIVGGHAVAMHGSPRRDYGR